MSQRTLIVAAPPAAISRVQRASLNMLSGGAGWAVPVVVNFLALPFLLRTLGDAAFGLQNLVAVITGYMAIMDVGLDVAVTKYVAEDEARGDRNARNRLLSSTFQVYAGIGIIGAAAILLSADVIVRQIFAVPDDLVEQGRTVMRLAGAGFLANVLLVWARAVAHGVQRYDVSNTLSVAGSVTGTGLGVLAVAAGYGVVGYVGTRVVISLLVGLLGLGLVYRLLPDARIQWGFDAAMLCRVRGYVAFGVVLRVSGVLVTGLDRTLIGAWWGVAAVGLYAVPWFIANALTQLMASILHFLFPMASELYGTKQLGSLQDVFTRASRFVVALATLVTVVALVFGDRFLQFWVGARVAGEASQVFRWLLLAAWLQTVAVCMVNSVMTGIGAVRAMMIYTIARGVLVGIGCIVLIRPFGIQGAGVALLFAGVGDVLFLLFTLRTYLRLPVAAFLRAAYLRPLGLGVAVTCAAVLAHPLTTSWASLATVVLVLGLGYAAAGYRLGVFGETEKRALMGLWQMATARRC